MEKKENFEPLFDAVIVKPIKESESKYGSIIVPDLGKDKNEMAEVVAVGPGKYTLMGTFLKTMLKVGDKVILPSMGFTKFEYDGEEYYIGSENQVLSKLI